MSDLTWGIIACAGLAALVTWLILRAPRHSPEMVEATERLGASAENVVAKTNALAEENAKLRAERDAALQAKSAQFEAWQSESTNLRADVAALERENEALRKELALLRPIADTADALCDGKNLPGEFGALREAIRARKEAGNG